MNRSEVQDYVLDAYARANEAQKAQLAEVLSPFTRMPSPSDELLDEVVKATQKVMKEKS